MTYMEIVGRNLKKIRTDKKITLRELGKKLDVSASFLSQVEVNKATPSLATLKKIADTLQTTIGTLVGEGRPPDHNPVLRANQRKALKGIGKNINMYLLTSADVNKQMEPLLFKLNKNSSSGNFTNKRFGQEFVFVFKGAIEFVLDNTRYILRKGDSVYFNSYVSHSFKNIYKGITEILWVVTPPTF